jgi:hypothetical protein
VSRSGVIEPRGSVGDALQRLLPLGAWVDKLDLPCKDADSPARADVAAHGMDHAENSGLIVATR